MSKKQNERVVEETRRLQPKQAHTNNRSLISYGLDCFGSDMI